MPWFKQARSQRLKLYFFRNAVCRLRLMLKIFLAMPLPLLNSKHASDKSNTSLLCVEVCAHGTGTSDWKHTSILRFTCAPSGLVSSTRTRTSISDLHMAQPSNVERSWRIARAIRWNTDGQNGALHDTHELEAIAEVSSLLAQELTIVARPPCQPLRNTATPTRNSPI